MAYELCCTECGREFTIEVLGPGDRAKCPDCGGAVVVPESPRLARRTSATDPDEDIQRAGCMVQGLPTFLVLIALLQAFTGIVFIIGSRVGGVGTLFLGLTLIATSIGSLGLAAAASHFLTTAERLERLIRNQGEAGTGK